jgi:hypothetical protein
VACDSSRCSVGSSGKPPAKERSNHHRDGREAVARRKRRAHRSRPWVRFGDGCSAVVGAMRLWVRFGGGYGAAVDAVRPRHAAAGGATTPPRTTQTTMFSRSRERTTSGAPDRRAAKRTARAVSDGSERPHETADARLHSHRANALSNEQRYFAHPDERSEHYGAVPRATERPKGAAERAAFLIDVFASGVSAGGRRPPLPLTPAAKMSVFNP